MLAQLDRMEAERRPVEDIPLREEGDDPVEDILRRAGEPLITEEMENSLRRCEARLEAAEARLPKPKVAPDDFGLDFAFPLPDYSAGPLPPPIMEPFLCDDFEGVAIDGAG